MSAPLLEQDYVIWLKWWRDDLADRLDGIPTTPSLADTEWLRLTLAELNAQIARYIPERFIPEPNDHPIWRTGIPSGGRKYVLMYEGRL